MGILRNKKPNPKWEYTKWLYFFLLAFAGTLIIWYYAMSQQVLEWLLSDIDTPIAFLEAYGYRYLAMMISTALNVILTLGFGIKALVFYIANHDNPEYADYKISTRIHQIPFTDYAMIILFLAFELFIISIFMIGLNPYGNYRRFAEDAQAVKTGNLITMDVFFDADHERGGLTQMEPNFYEPITTYHVTDTNTSKTSAIYVPDYLSFTVDQEYPYHYQRGHDWNRHHTTIYRITYTPNYRLVTSIEMIRMGTAP